MTLTQEMSDVSIPTDLELCVSVRVCDVRMPIDFDDSELCHSVVCDCDAYTSVTRLTFWMSESSWR